MSGSHYQCTAAAPCAPSEAGERRTAAALGEGIVGQQPPSWNPHDQHDPDQWHGQPPCQGQPGYPQQQYGQQQPYPGQPPYQQPPYQGQPPYGPPGAQFPYPGPWVRAAGAAAAPEEAPGPEHPRGHRRPVCRRLRDRRPVIPRHRRVDHAIRQLGHNRRDGQPGRHAQARGSRIGSYFDVGDGSGDTYRVSLVKIIDPARGRPSWTPRTTARGSSAPCSRSRR